MTIDDYNLINKQLLERFGTDLNVAKTIVINNGTKDVFMTILIGGLKHQTPYTFMDGVEKAFLGDRYYNSFIDKENDSSQFLRIIIEDINDLFYDSSSNDKTSICELESGTTNENIYCETNKLSNDYITNIEQSKRLVELGVPSNSSNYYYPLKPTENGGWKLCTDFTFIRKNEDLHPSEIPAWSVGRLIEILEVCVGAPWSDKQLLGCQSTLLERILSDIENVVKFNKIDFLKLK